MVKNKLSAAKVMLVLIILLCLGTVLGVTAYSLSLKNNPLANESSDWKTYTNEVHGYEFKYPKEWVIGGFDTPGSTNIGVGNDPSKRRMVIVGVGEKSEEVSLKEWLNEPGDTFYKTRNDQINQKGEGDYYGSTYIEEKITIGGIEGIDEILIWNSKPIRRSIILAIDKKVYTFSPAPMEGSQEYDNFNKLLSTFRLIEK